MSLSTITLCSIIFAIACYSSVFVHLFVQVQRKQAPNRLMCMTILSIGLLIHLYLIAPQIHTQDGLNFNIFNMLSFTSWLMLTFTVILNTYRPVLSLNLLAIPFACAGLIAGEFWQTAYAPTTHLSVGIRLHILLSLTAYCLLFMASIHSILLWAQNRELKRKITQKRWTTILPPLQTMESVLFDMIFIGFVLLTAALIFGAVYVDNLLTQHLVHKTVFSFMSWLIFGILIVGRLRLGWRGQRAVTFTLWGFALLFVGFLGSKIVLELILGKAV